MERKEILPITAMIELVGYRKALRRIGSIAAVVVAIVAKVFTAKIGQEQDKNKIRIEQRQDKKKITMEDVAS